LSYGPLKSVHIALRVHWVILIVVSVLLRIFGLVLMIKGIRLRDSCDRIYSVAFAVQEARTRNVVLIVITSQPLSVLARLNVVFDQRGLVSSSHLS
jgi:hypothetical protein